MKLPIRSLGLASVLVLPALLFVRAKDAVYSGPQPGEATTPFKSVEIVGADAGKERDVIVGNNGAATALVFVNGLERSMLPLMRVIDDYGARFQDKLKTEFVFLSANQAEGLQRFANSLNSIHLKSRSTLSIDGAEGPGNYGLNKDCLLTIVVARENKVHASFALVQPGIADGGSVLGAIARLIGDENPPTAEQLKAEQEKGQPMKRGTTPAAPGAKDPFPGAVPTDGKLNSLLRQFIRPTNDDAAIDALVTELRAYVKNSPDLTKQAVDGWTRILHFGDHYGTAYSRKQGQALLDEWKKPQ